MSFPLFPLRDDQGGPRSVAKAGVGPRPVPLGDQQPSAGAWKREMEQAQRNSWFKPGQATPPAEGRPEGAAGQASLSSGRLYPLSPNDAAKAGKMAEQVHAIARPVPDRSPAVQAPTVTADHFSRPEASRTPSTDIRLASLALALAGASRLRVTGLRPPADSRETVADLLHAPAEPAGLGEAANPDSQPIRLHAEWHGQDVTVWLGIDAQAETAEAQLARLLPHIRTCLHEQRSRLVKLVCNGRTVFEVSSFPVAASPYFTPPKELS
jgi:hypothetical protein